nr:sugar carrier protein C-like [Ipomoea batatas]
MGTPGLLKMMPEGKRCRISSRVGGNIGKDGGYGEEEKRAAEVEVKREVAKEGGRRKRGVAGLRTPLVRRTDFVAVAARRRELAAAQGRRSPTEKGGEEESLATAQRRQIFSDRFVYESMPNAARSASFVYELVPNAARPATPMMAGGFIFFLGALFNSFAQALWMLIVRHVLLGFGIEFVRDGAIKLQRSSQHLFPDFSSL